ncbi:glucuronate isomerase [Roseobacter sinensis]|uniref:Uronate isomerase n=1 Tax=Roseobacter sinensis TaxID=2931391 RepID=A0ABT3B9M0_9RHOB|nr:glucuronate isomerase [Roseobacter sp. WL0113]MCV3270276.1 glucuronate isomerase [Roseobacter sp. WL0113]
MHQLTGTAGALYEAIRDLPIVSPHGHCEPRWFAEDAPFPDPAALLVVPDHYVFRMLYSQGVSLEALGVPEPGRGADPRAVFRLFAQNWHLFLGTPSRFWMAYVLRQTLGIETPLSAETADAVYDQIAARLAEPGFRPRALFDRFGIEVLATTDAALDDLAHHAAVSESDWPGRVIPTFRPDAVLDPSHESFLSNIDELGRSTGEDVATFAGYLAALRARRGFFKARGATATDHAIEVIETVWLDDPEALYQKLRCGEAAEGEGRAFYGHMLIEMAQMSVEDGLVMQIHGGSRRNTNADVFARFGRDKGADIPIAVDWVRGLDALLNRVGNAPGFGLILFTLDETTYARELAPMAGHWPCLRIGPPWWFHDSAAGIARYFDQVVETAGYWNLAGFNDDTRAFLSIPARHDLWRRGVALHLEAQVGRGFFDMRDAEIVAPLLAVDLARDAYRLGA